MFEIVSTLLAVLMLAVIAFPKYFVPSAEGKKKKVGSSYWGVYEGESLEDAPDEGRVECPRPARKWHVVAGSSQYASGKGTSFRR